jgi:hypothetical protein
VLETVHESQTLATSKREHLLELTRVSFPRPSLGVPNAVAVDHVSRRWCHHGNALSPAVQETWAQIVDTFNRKLQSFGSHTARDWHVISAGTGTGKTETTIVYASLLPTFAPTAGMLIVTRMQAAGELLAREINTEAGREVAVAHHSDAKVDPEVMRTSPVLVITHAAFERAVERCDGGRVWDAFAAFGDGRRGLIVIDEAVDLLEVTKLTEDDLSRLVGSIPREARDRWPAQVRYLEDLLNELRRWVDLVRGNTDAQRIMRDADRQLFDKLFGQLPDFRELRAFMRSHWYIGSRRKGTKATANEELGQSFGHVFDQVGALVRSFVLFARRGKRTTFNSARMILPEDAQGCVILDATASVNRFYDVASREDGSFKIHRHTPPAGARSYRNVTLHVARVDATGKGSLTAMDDEGVNVGAREATRVAEWLATTEKASPVFIACHKDNGPHYTAIKDLDLKVGTYGSVDGSNQFRDCTTAVVFGLPWRDRVDASLTFFATQGVQPDSWLKDETARRFRGYSDIREELYLGWVATDLVQIVNRTAMRRVVNEHGDCPRCDVYVMLPRGERGDRILAALLAQLPGLTNVAPWNFDLAQRRTKATTVRTDYSEKLKTWAATLEPGSIVPAKFVREQLGCSAAKWDVLAASLKIPTSDLALALGALGVRYAVTRVGSKSVACIVRPNTKEIPT